MSKPWNARLWLSSKCAVPGQPDEALAKSSAKQINFSRNAGSLISRNAFIKRTPSLGSATSDSRNLLTCSSRLVFIVLRFIFYDQSLPTFVWAGHLYPASKLSFPPLMLSRYISNSLHTSVAPAASARCNQSWCIKIVKWFLSPNFCHSRASILSNSTVRLSALRG
jgi:hypothetical protein